MITPPHSATVSSMVVIVNGTAVRCECGADDLVLVRPGALPAADPVTDILLQRGSPMCGTCLACWPAEASAPLPA